MNIQVPNTEGSPYWQALINNQPASMYADKLEAGWYQSKQDAVMIRVRSNDAIMMRVNDEPVTDSDQQLKVWMTCARHAISKETYNYRVVEGKWPMEEAGIRKAQSLGDALSEYVDKFKAFKEKLKKEPIDSQIKADVAAGYVQQGRELIAEAKDVIDNVKMPYTSELDRIEGLYITPHKEIQGLNKDVLAKIAEYGGKQATQSNDPKFKFNAGKGHKSAKTIALRTKEEVTVSDEDKLFAMMRKDERFADDIKAAMELAGIEIAKKMAITHYNDTSEFLPGVRSENKYSAA